MLPFKVVSATLPMASTTPIFISPDISVKARLPEREKALNVPVPCPSILMALPEISVIEPYCAFSVMSVPRSATEFVSKVIFSPA